MVAGLLQRVRPGPQRVRSARRGTSGIARVIQDTLNVCEGIGLAGVQLQDGVNVCGGDVLLEENDVFALHAWRRRVPAEDEVLDVPARRTPSGEGKRFRVHGQIMGEAYPVCRHPRLLQ